MDRITESCSRHCGSYRAEFAENDLGMLVVPPEIRADYESVKFSVQMANSASGYDRVSNNARLFGEIKLSLAVRAELWQFLESQEWNSGELVLSPVGLSQCAFLRFPLAELLPRWEFEPAGTGSHVICLHWQLKADSAGKLFYTA